MQLFRIFSLAVLLYLCRKTETANMITGGYADILALNKSCSPKDSCMRGHLSILIGRAVSIIDSVDRTYYNTNCFCDSLCSKYGDCCVDYVKVPGVGLSGLGLDGLYSCIIPLNQFFSYYMINTCLPSFNHLQTISFCRNNISAITDPFLNCPVSNTVTKITYKNIYCAQCNFDIDNIVFWKATLKCQKTPVDVPIIPKYLNSPNLLQYLKYDSITGKWNPIIQGLGIDSCYTMFDEPDSIKGMIRRCKPNIGKCADDWIIPNIANLCNAYTAYIYDLENKTTYKNPHCAICNHVNLQTLSCDQTFPVTTTKPPITNAVFVAQVSQASTLSLSDLSFSILLDYYYPDGNYVGLKKPCPPYQMFDSFSNQCRDLNCGRYGQKDSNGMCTSLK